MAVIKVSKVGRELTRHLTRPARRSLYFAAVGAAARVGHPPWTGGVWCFSLTTLPGTLTNADNGIHVHPGLNGCLAGVTYALR
jgi:hypothetical protein